MKILLSITLLASFIVSFSQPSWPNPISVTDDLGRTITLPHPPQRIISLEPSVTETLYAVGAGNKIVADDLYSDYPSAAKAKIHVNGLGPSKEMVLGLRPDLIILFDQTFTVQKADDWARTYGAPVYVTSAGTYKGVEGDISRLGKLVGNEAKTVAVLKSMDMALIKVTAAVAKEPKPKVFVVIWDQPLMTAGRGTFIDDLINLSRGENVAAKRVSQFPTYSPEQLVADNPDIILTGTTGEAIKKQRVSGLGPLNLRADETRSSYAIPDDWTVRPGPRLALGLLAIAKVLHPACFKGN